MRSSSRPPRTTCWYAERSVIQTSANAGRALIQTLLNEWAYERIYGSSDERSAALPLFLERYNFKRPHGSLGHKPPASRLTKVAGNYS